MRFRCAVTFALCLLVPSLVSARAQKTDDKDIAEVRSYVLTMDNVKRFYTAMYQIKQTAEKDSSLQKAMNAESDDSKDSQSLSGVTAKLSAFAPVVAIIANNGFTPRQFVVAEFAVIQSGFAAAAVKAGAPREKLISEGAVSAANLDFVEKHQAELYELGKKYPLQ